MSSYTPAVPSANGGTNAVSQDTFAASGAAVSGAGGGGGGGGSYPANPQFSTIALGQDGFINFSTLTGPTYSTVDPGLKASQNTANAITQNYPEAVVQTTGGGADTYSANPFGAGAFVVLTNLTTTNQVSGVMGNATGTPGNIDIVTYNNNTNTTGDAFISLKGLTSVSSLTVSSINGQIPGGGTYSYPANVQFSTITMDPATGYISTAYLSASGNGSYGPSIILPTAPGAANTSFSLAFHSAGQDSVGPGQLIIGKTGWPGVTGSGVEGLGVYAYSTIFGSFQPVCCGDLYINNGDGAGNGTGLVSYVDSVSSLKLEAAGGSVTASSMSISSINNVNFMALVSTVAGLSPA